MAEVKERRKHRTKGGEGDAPGERVSGRAEKTEGWLLGQEQVDTDSHLGAWTLGPPWALRAPVESYRNRTLEGCGGLWGCESQKVSEACTF